MAESILGVPLGMAKTFVAKKGEKTIRDTELILATLICIQ
jgi:hypothetical protein